MFPRAPTERVAWHHRLTTVTLTSYPVGALRVKQGYYLSNKPRTSSLAREPSVPCQTRYHLTPWHYRNRTCASTPWEYQHHQIVPPMRPCISPQNTDP